MFEVGKLADESMDSLVEELEKVSQVEGEGEAARYFSHAITLKDTIRFFRQNAAFKDNSGIHFFCVLKPTKNIYSFWFFFVPLKFLKCG